MRKLGYLALALLLALLAAACGSTSKSSSGSTSGSTSTAASCGNKDDLNLVTTGPLTIGPDTPALPPRPRDDRPRHPGLPALVRRHAAQAVAGERPEQRPGLRERRRLRGRQAAR